MVADSYDAAYFGRINSVMVIFVTVAITVAPFAAGVVYDLSGSYQPVLLMVSGFCALAVILISALPRKT